MKVEEESHAADGTALPARPTSGGRRGVVNHDNYVDLIVAGRKKKQSKFIGSTDQPSTRRPRRIIISDKDYKYIFSSTAGTLQDHEYAERPEIEIAVIKMLNMNAVNVAREALLIEESMELAKEKSSQLVPSSTFDMSMELSAAPGPNDSKFYLLYDDARCAFVLTQSIEDRMLTVLREFSERVRLTKERIEATKLKKALMSVPKIAEEKNKENNKQQPLNPRHDRRPKDYEDDSTTEENTLVDNQQLLQIGITEASSLEPLETIEAFPTEDWQLTLESSFFLYGKNRDLRAYYTIDSRRQRLWRRYIRLYIDPILNDGVKFAEMQMRLAKEVERKAEEAMKDEEIIYTPTDSEESSVDSTPGRKKVAKKKPGTVGGGKNKDEKDNKAQEKSKKKDKGKEPRTALMKRMASKKLK